MAPRFESLGVWFNDTHEPVTDIDFFGNVPTGRLRRVDALKPGLFWHVWAEFFPHTDINRIDGPPDTRSEPAQPGL